MASLKIDEIVFDKLAEILKKHNLTEIEYSNGDTRIKLSMNSQNTGMVCAPNMLHQNFITENVQVSPDPSTSMNLESLLHHPGAVKSPMVGTCYTAPEPGAPNFVAVGDSVQEGQPILIIEAMKVMNMIKAPRAGKIKHIAVANAEPVEFDQLLMVIE